MRKRFRRKLRSLKAELRRQLHSSVPQVGRWLRSVVQGWFNYHAIPGNTQAIKNFRYQVLLMWRQILSRRSQKAKIAWPRMAHLADRYLPKPRILHPYPWERLRV